jgi:hypothetical protein
MNMVVLLMILTCQGAALLFFVKKGNDFWVTGHGWHPWMSRFIGEPDTVGTEGVGAQTAIVGSMMAQIRLRLPSFLTSPPAQSQKAGLSSSWSII